MNEAHLHLLVNHVPIIGGAFATLVLAWGVIRNNNAVKQTGMALLVVAGMASLTADLTGEGAEEVVEQAGVPFNDAMIEEHEEAATLANIVMLAAAALSLATMVVRKLRESRVASIAVLIVAIAACGLMVRTGNLGGKIRHSEIGAATAAPGGGGAAGEVGDDDD